MRTLDRYIIREIIPPFVIALLVFTFILIIPFILDLAEQMIAKGVPWTTILRLILMLVPMSLALTIPMALLIGILVAFGRLSSDREVVVMMACGISPYRLLRPVLAFAVVCWGLDSWVLLRAMPDGNQKSREITQEIAMDRAEGEVRPRVFFEDFPGIVLYVNEVPMGGAGWSDVMAADSTNRRCPGLPRIACAQARSTSAGRSTRSRRRRRRCGAASTPSVRSCSSRSRAFSTRRALHRASTRSGRTAMSRTARRST